MERIDNKIDTQGMSGPALTPEAAAKAPKKENKPMLVRPRRLFTPEYVKEMKILLHEVLDEREGKMDYISYFDTDHFQYRVGEEEPPYKS